MSPEQEEQFSGIAESLRGSDSVKWDLLVARDSSLATDSALAICEWMRTDVPLKEAEQRLDVVVASRADDPAEAGSLAFWAEHGSEVVFCPEYADVLEHAWD